MTVKELIKELHKMDPEKSVYFRDGRKCKDVTMVTNSPHTNGMLVELTNEECNLPYKKP
ncbi:hypothetical protein [uncultured Duncaniella sp.]|jgi:hypothetical protein|uniref:hypothetical protein n=1 Tax=uncultured Duncaniella sp. TaxID=2768039 RepID=UPI0026088D7E|nr:hypothetical protein [uncultured Duncaniella sp.]